ncbi:disease resistance protein RPM1 [Vigna unguiculata]|uniref:Disease resistance protein RPM1 n=1 Tax=Vigna unguiculata TaxID=3917 RepID=A0A4D6M402_VIGUN|nr:disease resistance protein RPM1 [Vigna unguiculata]
MAAELVSGALLSAFLQVAFEKLASTQFADFFRGRKLDEKLLGNLNIMLHSINALAHDAEQKQFTDPHIKAWLFSVKEAVFDAEDILDEIDYEITRCKVEAESEPQTFTYKVLTHELFSKLKFLRVLSLHGYSDLKEVPDSVGNLKHLRSIDLSCTLIQKLPDSICLLYNLLILKLNHCFYVEELPSNLHKLTKLRCLEFENTKVTKMPMHFGELKNLRVLNMYCVDRISEFSTKQLGGLNLYGRLSINDVQNIVNPLDALDANLKNQHLHLELNFTLRLVPSRLRGLMEGLLSSLKSLEIMGLEGIVSIGAEFYGSDSSSFRSLETLKFYNMKELEEWECKTTSFPRLQNLHIYLCHKLKGLPNQLLHLKNLDIGCCDKLVISINKMFASSLQLLTVVNMPSTNYDFLEAMEINSDCVHFTIFPLDFFPNLRVLRLSWCQNLKGVSQEHAHNHLKVLGIGDCPQFESFPSEGLSAPWLQILSIRGAENLELMPKRMQFLLPSLTDLVIIDCPKVEMFPDEGLPSNLKTMSLSSLKLIASLRDTLGSNTCLERLIVEKLDVESFPGEVLYACSLLRKDMKKIVITLCSSYILGKTRGQAGSSKGPRKTSTPEREIEAKGVMKCKCF